MYVITMQRVHECLCLYLVFTRVRQKLRSETGALSRAYFHMVHPICVKDNFCLWNSITSSPGALPNRVLSPAPTPNSTQPNCIDLTLTLSSPNPNYSPNPNPLIRTTQLLTYTLAPLCPPVTTFEQLQPFIVSNQTCRCTLPKMHLLFSAIALVTDGSRYFLFDSNWVKHKNSHVTECVQQLFNCFFIASLLTLDYTVDEFAMACQQLFGGCIS